MRVVRTGSRLHFGLLSAGEEEAGVRQFGGVGLMVQKPGLRVCLEPASRWSAEGPLAERALIFARRLASAWPEGGSYHIVVEEGLPEHAGLGTGTQLALAVGRALALALGRAEAEVIDLARFLGRGQRSAIGIHGFARGGFLVDGGKGPETAIAPLVARADFPEDWHIVLVIPQGAQGFHGLSEGQAFMRLAGKSTGVSSAALCRLVLLGMLPALLEKDLPLFGEAVYEFNRRVGEMFRPVQGGTYSLPLAAEVVEYLRGQKVAGVGQSSWGPTLFALIEEDRAQPLARKIRDRFGFGQNEVLITKAANQGAD